MMATELQLFFSAPPGLESHLLAEARELGFQGVTEEAGGVLAVGDWSDVWRANLSLRGASRVLVRLGEFRAAHLSELDKKSRRIDWSETLRSDVPVTVEATCKRSRIYHSAAASQRVATALHEAIGAPIAKEAPITVSARLVKDICTISIDTSGELLHKRGYKHAVSKAPLRETLAALLLRACRYRPDEPLVDPMCGSGVFLIEAAEMGAGLMPGRIRQFAFEQLASFDASQWRAMRNAAPIAPVAAAAPLFGSDRDAGAIEAAQANAARADIAERIRFAQQAISDLNPPCDAPGLVIVNPPYGGRIGEKGKLKPLYAALGATLLNRFKGWRAGFITSEPGLARATGLPIVSESAPIPHGGLRIRLYQTATL
ncbi:MAG: class I SAM-dependent RNA methyltransferase [Neomegalonema sp.]|nr:class I SAM-dependent RNA methyltransferase [Neomegalonema sp.]